MQLIEVSLAAVLLTAASGGSLQLWAASGGQQKQLASRSEVEERIELDRLQLQARWRQAIAPGQTCSAVEEQLEPVAARIQPPPQVQRTLSPASDGRGLEVVWSGLEQPMLERQRRFTAAGLGLC
ncbi:hypothetical protein MY494_05330 [Synechococcus sp. A10-1-5-1]|uniref:hypothetical protein n=1 Tax=Synechococcus sp. A10-1-5-1 TaxID=2936507 RepID=UPI00200185C1|nr:hypothetical protein [Synechococcus sp. A10-1-5-1]UPM51182.1 hypothetical protein MY494_05330 [Synechococcus sp. A10-1-5-1]